MTTFFKNILRDPLVQCNILVIFSFFVSVFIENQTGIHFFRQTFGIFFILFSFPLLIAHLLWSNTSSFLEKYLVGIIYFFSFLTPVFFFLNLFFSFKISITNILILSGIMLLLSLVISRRREHTFPEFHLEKKSIKNLFVKEKIFFIALLMFFGIHAINYHFYEFIPEWDGYTDILNIEKGVETGLIQKTYRGFFQTSAIILSSFSGINPYYVFAVIFIALQSSIIIVARLFLEKYTLTKNTLASSLVYALALSIPVLNMEIDMTRPQNIFIILFPIFLFFSFRFFHEQHFLSACMALVIAFSGMNYHEFFVFPALLSLIWIAYIIIRLYKNAGDKKDRIISLLLLLCFFLIFTIIVREIHFLGNSFLILKKIIFSISDTSQWKWWFLNNYSADGSSEVGWRGTFDIAKYYGYYLSPGSIFVLALLIILIFQKPHFFKDELVRITSLFIIIFISFAEILPRLNYTYLPERFWLLINLCLLFVFIPILKEVFRKNKLHNKIFFCAFSLLCLIGICGSFFIAHEKKAITSQNEYNVAMWIKENTPSNAFFITQSANGPMIRFFAKRDIVPFNQEYFFSDKLIKQNTDYTIKNLKIELHAEIQVTDETTQSYISKKISSSEFLEKIKEHSERIKKIQEDITHFEKTAENPLYILYSYDKFNTMYQSRDWWIKANAYGASIKKFDHAYPLIYQKNGIYIWKVH